MSKPGATSPTRRSVAAGTAWAVPSILVAAAAPAAAASPRIVMSHITRFQWFNNSADWCQSGRDGLRFNTTATGTGTTFTNTRTTTSITNVYAIFWWARTDIVWSADTGNSGCWSVPTLISTTAVDGLYPYRSNYTCAITPVNGTTRLQPYAWRSQCYDQSDWSRERYVRRQAFGTVNGQQQTTDTGRFPIQS